MIGPRRASNLRLVLAVGVLLLTIGAAWRGRMRVRVAP